jgi:hypothetical protein
VKDDVSICQKCFCMTHTRLGMCWKCHADKPSKTEQPVGDRALAIATERIESKKAHPESFWRGKCFEEIDKMHKMLTDTEKKLVRREKKKVK